ncbi:MAG: hypothetical protein KME46_18760 [Brasilonema angustatum HA4187-MV1]|jgi:hypothetical protein|nr:hypothetical protein [Brasilonema angustatum HA4187-MV1]
MTNVVDALVVNAGDSAVVSFEQLVPRHWVHKTLQENVYLTSVARQSDNKFLCGAIIPQLQQHFLNAATRPAENILLLTEIARQVGIACTHRLFNVPFNFTFLLSQFVCDLDIHNLSLLRNRMINEVTIYMTMRDTVDGTTEKLTTMNSDFSFFYEQKLIWRGKFDWSFMPSKRYKRLRSLTRQKQVLPSNNLPPLPTQVSWEAQRKQRGTRSPTASVLAVSSDAVELVKEATLVVDEQDLFFFDHYCDHVPGMLIFQGFNELAIRYCADSAPNYVTQAELNFHNFAELNLPVRLSVLGCNSNSLSRSVQLQATQNNHLLAQATLRVSNLKEI